MRKLGLYIVKENIGPLLTGSLFFTFVFVMEVILRIIRLIIEKDVPMKMSLELFAYLLPFNLAITIPMAVLMGSIMAFGRLSSDTEVVAMRASGLSSFNIFTPITIFGVFMFVFMLFFNSFVLPAANYRYRAMYMYIININPSVGVIENQFIDIPGTGKKIAASWVKNDIMSNVVINDEEATKDEKWIVTSKYGRWENNESNSRLIQLVLKDGLIQEIDKKDKKKVSYTAFEELNISFVRSINDTIGGHQKGMREMSLIEIKKSIDDNIESGETPSDESIVEFHKKFSIPFACIIFVILGSPLGIVSKRSGKGMSLGMSIVVIFLYYIFLIIGETLGRAGFLTPALTIWLPNILLGILAALVMGRSIIKNR